MDIKNKLAVFVIGLLIVLMIIYTVMLMGGHDTSVILVSKSGNLSFVGFGRGQSTFSMQCIACPHVGAKVNVSLSNGTFLCQGVNELIVSDTENVELRVNCAGLENYENKTARIFVEGFTGGKTEPVRDFKFNEEVLIQFEKV